MLQNIPKEKIIEVLQQGPTIPSKIVKVVGGDTMLIGAMLSSLISTGEVKYSSLKIGGSPVYYLPEQEEKLEEFIGYLNDKDQKTARLLKEEKVIQDSKQEPLIRFSLKTIKDFAKPFELKGELFYRYFLVNREDAEILANNILNEQNTQKITVDSKSTLTAKETALQHTATSEPLEDTSLESKSNLSESVVAEPVHAEKKVHEKEGFKKDFFETIKAHIYGLGLDIVGKEKIKKTEYVLILKNHDSNEYYYCVAKDKKTINEGDLSTAFVFAHQKRMPCIFLMTGRLTKKAELMSQKEFKDMKIEKL